MKNFDDAFGLACESINIYDGPDLFLQSFSAADRDAALIYAATFCQSEICNGGFHQFFFNSTGVLAPEAVEAFTRLGMPDTADVVRQACDRLGSAFPRERPARQGLLREREFRDLDDRFYELLEQENGGFEAASQRFIDAVNARNR